MPETLLAEDGQRRGDAVSNTLMLMSIICRAARKHA